MPLRTLSLPADAGLWPQLCERMLADCAAGTLTQSWVIVPTLHQRAALLNAFAQQAAKQQRSLIPPRIVLLEQWLAQHGVALASGLSLWQLQADTYVALRGNAWIRAQFGETPAQLWALARTLVQLSDQLCFAAFRNARDFDAGFEAAVARHYQHLGGHLAVAEARLVLEIWHQQAADWPASRTLQAMQTVLQQTPIAPLWWLADQPLLPWQQTFLEQWAQRGDLTLIQADASATLAHTSLFAAAWPTESMPAPLRTRALALHDVAPPKLTILGADSMEQEAQAIATQVVTWLQQGETSIALVALDRLTTRRVRALLERAQVLLRDETGWRLSTTSAAGAVMRWFDVVRNQGYFRDVLDWLQSPFVLPGRDKQAALRLLQEGLAAHGVLRGWEGLRAMLAALRVADDEQETQQELCRWFEHLQQHAQAAEKFSGSAAQHFALLRAALSTFGLDESLAQDAVGRSVLQLLQELESSLQGQSARLQAQEFRALLAHCFEHNNHSNDRQEAGDSPVAVVSLSGAHLRAFHKVIVIGASADFLPAAAPEALFLGDALCAELGLPTQVQARQQQFSCWLSLLASAQQVIATWCNAHSDQPQVLSPWLAQYQTVARLAGLNVQHTAALPVIEVAAQASTQPAPRAPAYWPVSLSASAYQALIDCPYRFFARSILGLSAADEVEETVDARRRGQAIHTILEHFHRDCAREPQRYATRAAQSELLRNHCARTFAPLLSMASDYLGGQLEFEQLIPDYLDWWAQQRADGWQWEKAEEKLQRALHCEVHTEDQPLLLKGRIDRIDRHMEDGTAQLIDYKTTPASALRTTLKIPGEKIQLPFYALLQQEDTCSAAYLSLHKSGVTAITPPQDLAASSRTLAARLRHDMTRIQAGAALPAQGIDAVCANCEARGLCRRDEWLSKGGEAA